MTNPSSVLQQVRSLGVDIRPDGDKLQLRPPGKVPADLIQALRENKPAIIAILTKPSVALSAALTQKTQEITVMRRRLASEYYANDAEYLEWCKDQIGCLTGHVDEIRRYLRDGGSLRLPPCCKEDSICMIAMRRFDGCLMNPDECTFSMQTTDAGTATGSESGNNTHYRCPFPEGMQ
jgi:hypothetical protein